MKKPNSTELFFLALVVLILGGLPYIILTWHPNDDGRVINVAGYNLADPEPGVWVVSEGRPVFSKDKNNVIRVKQGEQVTLRLSSMDVVHGFNLSFYNLSTLIYPGKVETLEFTADEPGEFEFYCSARSCGPGHLGMKGTLIVEPGLP